MLPSVPPVWSKKLGSGILLTVSLLTLACTNQNPKNEIRVGVFGPLTGGSAPMGLSMKNGVALAIEEINAAGGILDGKTFVMVERDDEAKNDLGGPIMQELIDKENVVAILGPANTGVANAASRYANERKIPMIINVSAGAKVNELFADSLENFVFHFAAKDDVQAKMMVDEALKKKQFKNLALLCDDTSYGQGGREKIEAVLAKAGRKPVYVGKFKIRDADMSAQLLKAKAAGADVILAYGIGPELAAISNSMKRTGFIVPMIASWTAAMSNYVDSAGANGNGTLMPQTFIEESPKNEIGKKFVVAYRARFNEKRIASAVAAAQGYDSMKLLMLAMKQAGSTDGVKVKAALEDLRITYEGVTGTYSPAFTKSDHEAIESAHVEMGVITNGKVVRQ